MITNVILLLYDSSINKKLILSDLRFRRNGSVVTAHLLSHRHLLAILISLFFIISNISFQRFKNLNIIYAFVNTAKRLFRRSLCVLLCVAKIDFVDADFICLVTGQILEFDLKDDAHF